MINTRIEIDGTEEEVQLFEDMFEYVSYYGSDISHYVLSSDSEENFIIEAENFIDDEDFQIIDDYGEYRINEEIYIRVNWGEKEISMIKEDGYDQVLYSIFQKLDDGLYHNYKSLIFSSEEDAQKKADELNEEA